MIEKIILNPFQKFVKIESLSGILLFGATLLALIWANSPYASTYHELWDYKVGFSSEGFKLTKPLILWINDGLMAVFFFVIGLEIKRELSIGELNSVKKAGMPIAAAIGGMAIPVLLFFLLNDDPSTAHGWGISMATDIAFSLAILQLLGKRAPLSLKIFLTAFAIIDDIGAVLVIALFYSSSIQWDLIGIAFLLLLFLFAISYWKIYSKYITVIFGIIIWVLFLKAGIHPTIAGVLLAFTVPIHQRMSMSENIGQLQSILKNIQNAKYVDEPVLTNEQIHEIDNLEDWTCKVQSPLQHLEHKLHNWVAYFIMPLFAFANAGVTIQLDMDLNTPLILTIIVALFIGKSVGVTLFTWLGIRLKIIDKPGDISYQQIIGIGALAGVGFTMSIFIANLAFNDDPVLLGSAKIGIILASIIAGTVGYLILRLAKPMVIED
jgi:NhaA family Na+:H+ antiporter